jgi:hypothetical protein
VILMPHYERDLLVGLSARRFFLPGGFGEGI